MRPLLFLTFLPALIPRAPATTAEQWAVFEIPGEMRFIYQPRRGIYDWKGTLVKNLEPGVRYAAFYFDPATGRRFDQGIVEPATGEYRTNRLPSPQDWVLVLVNNARK